MSGKAKMSRRQRYLLRRSAAEAAQEARYAAVREWARETSQRAFRVACDPNATEEERAEAWRQCAEAGTWRIAVHRGEA